MDIKEKEDRLVKMVNRWRHNPHLFVKECLRVKFVTNQQKEALELCRKMVISKLMKRAVAEGKPIKGEFTDELREFARKKGISIMSGKGTGKDALVSWIIYWFLLYRNAKIICTAPIQDQLRKILWAEVTKWGNMRVEGSEEYAFLLRDCYKIDAEKISFVQDGHNASGKEWFAFQRVAKPNTNEEEQKATLSGNHAENMLIIGDEASGIPDKVFEPLEDTLTQANNWCILIFNPHRRAGFAIDTQYNDRISKQWCQLQWNAEESDMVDKEHIQNMIERFGKDSDQYRVGVLGLPPLGGDGVLIPWEWAYDATMREIDDDKTMPVILGVDVARHGNDKTVVCARRGMKVLDFHTFSGLDTVEVAQKVLGYYYDYNAKAVFVDGIGVGAGVYDQLRQFINTAYNVEVSRKASNEEKFVGLRDELWWRLRERFEAGTIALPKNCPDLVEELTCVKYDTESSRGKIKVESKKEIKKKLGGRSTDYADALALTFKMKDEMFRTKMVDFKRKELAAVGGETRNTSWMVI